MAQHRTGEKPLPAPMMTQFTDIFHGASIVNLSDGETGSWRIKNKIKTTATDALDPYITRVSATMVLTMYDKWVLVFRDRYHLAAPFQY